MLTAHVLFDSAVIRTTPCQVPQPSNRYSGEIEHGKWKFTADVGTDAGGNDEGPGPGVLERAIPVERVIEINQVP